ncbi:MAG: flavin reductase family protein [Candidatus Dadabacteria bacterium]|nr:MAG: flavin reductase family protein [Candidatus Dadabacteria bacterium]
MPESSSWKPGFPVESPVDNFVTFNPTQADTKSVYKLLIGAIIPRPIAFVSTVSVDGIGNLAPFSFFNGVSSNPPALVISIAQREENKYKHTLQNIKDTGEFVVNSANEWLIEPLVYTAAEYPSEIDELNAVGLTALPSQLVKPARVKESAIQFECKLYETVQIGDGSPGSSTLVIGEIVLAHIWKKAWHDGKILPEAVKPVARMGGTAYAKIGEIFNRPVPSIKDQLCSD